MSYTGLLENGDREYAKYLRCSDLEDIETLTIREFEILKLSSHGLTALEIGLILHVSHETVKSHRKSIIMKTGSKNMLEASCDALRHGWIQ